MPDRLSRLSAAIRVQGRASRRPLRAVINDNAGPIACACPSEVEPPEPRWEGPGDILALGVQDGRHRLGAVRAAMATGVDGGAPADMKTLHRLLAHYGVWLGFEGRAQRVRGGKLRWLPVLVSPQGAIPGRDREGVQGRVEYRLDLRRIVRESQRLTADATILLDGRPAATLDGLSIAFRPARPPGAPARSRPARNPVSSDAPRAR